MVRRLIIAVAVAVVCCNPLSLSGPLAAVPAHSGPAATSEQRLALVIGNSTYKESPLRNPVNDARAMASTLQRLGFEVIALEDASARRMQQAILDFGEKLKVGGVGLFYYAGHGLQVRGQNYLVPVDAEITSESAVRFEAVAVESVTEQMDEAANRVNVIILDACRNNPFERRLRGGSRGLAAMDAARGTLVAYATAPGSVALDGDGDHGLYTSELLKVLSEPDLKVEEVFKRVRSSVVKRTGGKQTPWESSSLTGDFVFHLTITVSPPAPSASGFDERQLELSYWNSIKDTTSPVLFRGYLERYPQGTFAAIAQFKLEELERKPPQATVVTPPSPPVLPGQEALAVPKSAGPEIEATTGRFLTVRRAAVREQPATTGKVVATLAPDTVVTVTGKVKNSNWYQVAQGDKVRGFVRGDLIEEARAVEEVAWQRVKEADDSATLAAFLKRFPDGAYAEAARARRASLLREEARLNPAIQPGRVSPPPATVAPTPANPSSRVAIGRITEVYSQYGYIVFEKDEAAAVRVGDIVFAQTSGGELVRLRVERALGSRVSAIPREGTAKLSDGLLVLK